MKKAILTLIILLCLPSVAAAKNGVVFTGRNPAFVAQAQQWVNAAYIRKPRGVKRIPIGGTAPKACGGAKGCIASPQCPESCLFLTPTSPTLRFDLLHELGHIYDFDGIISKRRRAVYCSIVGLDCSQWYRMGYGSGAELFADLFAYCGMYYDYAAFSADPLPPTPPYGEYPRPETFQRICWLMR